MSEGIGASVRRRRVEAGIRQDHLAQRVGISASHLSRFERGKRHVSLATLDAIVRALLELGVEPLPELTRSDLEESAAVDDRPGSAPDGRPPSAPPSASEGASESAPETAADTPLDNRSSVADETSEQAD